MFNSGRTGMFWENGRRDAQITRVEGTPGASECSHNYVCTTHIRQMYILFSHLPTHKNTNRIVHAQSTLNNLMLLDSETSCSVILKQHVGHTHISLTHTIGLIVTEFRKITLVGAHFAH